MRRFASNVVPHVLAIGSVLAVATGFVAARFTGDGQDRTSIFALNVIYWLL